jgi:hypothetical protein
MSRSFTHHTIITNPFWLPRRLIEVWDYRRLQDELVANGEQNYPETLTQLPIENKRKITMILEKCRALKYLPVSVDFGRPHCCKNFAL